MLKSQLWQLYLHGCQTSIQEAQAQLDAVEASYKEQKAALDSKAGDVSTKVGAAGRGVVKVGLTWHGLAGASLEGRACVGGQATKGL